MDKNKTSLIKKLAKVMKEVKYVEKRGYNSFNKYKYATETDVAEKVREILAEQDVLMIPNMKSHSVREHTNRKGNTEYIVTAEVEFTFYDGESGETLSFTVYGEGQDSGDKATYKAITGAQKYALMKAFMIPTGDDPEEAEQEKNNEPSNIQQNHTNDDQSTEGQRKAIYAISKKKEITEEEMKQLIYGHFKVHTSKKLSKQNASDLIKMMKEMDTNELRQLAQSYKIA